MTVWAARSHTSGGTLAAVCTPAGAANLGARVPRLLHKPDRLRRRLGGCRASQHRRRRTRHGAGQHAACKGRQNDDHPRGDGRPAGVR
eukprot:3924902-Prymnesium_polylepis.1